MSRPPSLRPFLRQTARGGVMRRATPVALGLTAAVLLSGCVAMVPHVVDTSVPVADARGAVDRALASCTTRPDLAAAAFALVNDQRRAAGGAALTRGDAAQQRAAQAHACEMAQRGQLDHRGANGSNVATRVRASGGTGCGLGENIAVARSPASAVGVWMGSADHRRNITDPRYRGGAMAAAQDARGRIWWAQVFSMGCLA